MPAETHAYDLHEFANAANYKEWLLDRARPYLHGRILDFGAGIGTFSSELLQRCPDVVALEPDAEFRAVLRRSVPELPVVSEPSELDGSFDAVVCFNVLEHIDDDDAALRGMHSVLRPGGTALLLVPAHPWLFGSVDTSYGHRRRYTVDGLHSELVRAGLTPVDVRYVNPVGVAGWFVAGRVLNATALPKRQLQLFDRAVPVLRAADRLRLPFGLSVWAAASR